jgi:hypothetical protein
MPDSSAAHVGDNAPKADLSDTSKKEHCAHCAEHGARLDAVEKHLGIKAEKGVAKEERGVHRDRKRH